MSQQHYVKAEKNTRSECREVSPVIVEIELSDKEKAHPGDAKNYRCEVAPMKLLTNDERPENKDIDRSSILKKDRVGGGGMLCGPNKKKEQCPVDHASDGAKKINFEARTMS
jgi:hypothetical protein